MIEVVFGESEAALIRQSQLDHFLVRHKTEAEDVICLGWMMEIGDIQQEATSPYRQNLIFSMCPQNQWKHRPEIIEEFRNLGKKYNDEFQKLVHLLSLDHPIRIWYSSAPYALCGFYHLCFLLKETDVPISAVNLPPYVIKDNVVLEYANWGEVAPEELCYFLSYERPVTKQELSMFSHKWKFLKKENSPLRAVLNGQLTSVKEDFYDFLLKEALLKGPMKEAECIGTLLGVMPTGMRDYWWHNRIEKLIHQGDLCLLETSDRPYARTISLP
ncbi:MAG: DUF1835 domain-containing protein [Clostridiales bacterium]|nr:DUF1835 domain-containing protein [Clostridiales bacterium]